MDASQTCGDVVGRLQLELFLGEFFLVLPPRAIQAAIALFVVLGDAGEEELAFLAFRDFEVSFRLELSFAELVTGSAVAGKRLAKSP